MNRKNPLPNSNRSGTKLNSPRAHRCSCKIEQEKIKLISALGHQFQPKHCVSIFPHLNIFLSLGEAMSDCEKMNAADDEKTKDCTEVKGNLSVVPRLHVQREDKQLSHTTPLLIIWHHLSCVVYSLYGYTKMFSFYFVLL